ncbi:Putative protein of unknown function [Podospora comata]|uniref:Heterokaryon incompatibility domain-containing protein n=1 Tax=Podospora comata TaxID=48703 RepID=A0ABY6S275_PODCO|nr:Putative protein of unknown function [Podospora comata]
MQAYLQTVVKYDMLSHRWLLEGEPSFEDMTDGTAASTAGYQKLRSFCEVSRSEFVWSDTCCIDKRSSSELHELIQSMFKWYRNATVCCVHLAQVLPRTTSSSHAASRSSIRTSVTFAAELMPTIEPSEMEWALGVDY